MRSAVIRDAVGEVVKARARGGSASVAEIVLDRLAVGAREAARDVAAPADGEHRTVAQLGEGALVQSRLVQLAAESVARPAVVGVGDDVAVVGIMHVAEQDPPRVRAGKREAKSG